MGVVRELFGKTKDGTEVFLYSLANSNGMKAVLTDLGARLVRLYVPDKNGNLRDVVLGNDTVQAYENIENFYGATVGRNANRIAGAEFCLNGTVYSLAANDNKNNLHSNPNGYHVRVWEANLGDNELGDCVTFSLFSPDGDQGYPGNLEVSVTYTLTEENALMIHYRAVGDQNTIVNLTNHSFFNLNGHESGSIINHQVWMDADYFTKADAESIPTGELVAVKDTPMDFTALRRVGDAIDSDYEAIVFGKGYDHNWVLNNQEEFELVARAIGDQSGIEMEVYTDLPGMQLYTGNFIDHEAGKDGVIYEKRDGICFETQYFPDAIHHSNFASPVRKAGEEYETTTVYKFC